VKKMKEAERMANTQKLLAQSIESEGEEDEARGGSDLDDHKPASGKPSLEDIDGSYSPFPPVCLDDDGELILSQAEEEAQDKVVRAVSPPGAAWDSDTYDIPDLHHAAVNVFIDIAVVVYTGGGISRLRTLGSWAKPRAPRQPRPMTAVPAAPSRRRRRTTSFLHAVMMVLQTMITRPGASSFARSSARNAPTEMRSTQRR
jgi:hypothetical protein